MTKFMLIEFGHLSDLMVEMRLSLGHRHKLNEEAKAIDRNIYLIISWLR